MAHPSGRTKYSCQYPSISLSVRKWGKCELSRRVAVLFTKTGPGTCIKDLNETLSFQFIQSHNKRGYYELNILSTNLKVNEQQNIRSPVR
jgi:hypothetical protein